MNFKSVINFIKEHDKFILTAHETPDGDAIGSEYALLKALQKLGKTARIINADPTPTNFQFIDEKHEVEVYKQGIVSPEELKSSVLLILDVNDIGNIGDVAIYILPKVKDYFIIDHHEYDADMLADNLIQRNASSTAEILYQLFEEMKIEIDLTMAKALFMAIVYDTGFFIYPKTSALTFQIGYGLVRQGVNPNEIYRRVYECRSISFLVLQSKVMGTLELKFHNHVAIQTMSKAMLEESGAAYDEGQQLINIPLASEDVKISIFFKENTDGLLRCSLRSKDDIDVARVAHIYNGGGHKTAAGFKCREPLEVIKKKLLNQLRQMYFPEEDNETT